MTNLDVSIWMPLYIGDYRKETAHLTTEENGAYLLLQMQYWTTAKPIPDNDERLARIVGLSQDEWLQIRSMISPYFRIADGKWSHDKLDERLQEAADNRRNNHKRAKHAADARWGNNAPSMPEAMPDAMPKAMPKAMPRQSPSPSPPSSPPSISGPPPATQRLSTRKKEGDGNEDL